jgi:transcriptional regulator with XRE-family HTH domain
MIEEFDTEVIAPDAGDQEHRPARSVRRADEIDRHVGTRARRRRIMLGLTQQQVADLVGITVQQACKYETGRARVPSGRLYQLAQALNVDVSYFFEGTDDPLEMTHRQRLLRELARNFIAMPSRRHQEELISLARVLAQSDTEPLRSRRGPSPSSRI